MSALLVALLFGSAFVASVWTLVTSIRPQIHRYRALFAPAPTMTPPPLVPTRVTVRWPAPARPAPAFPLRAAA